MGREADHSPPSSAEVKKDVSKPPLSYMSSQGLLYLILPKMYR
jgi:hypothetical protein